MAIPVWTELTWEEVRDLDRGRAVAVLPVGAVEAHGPHLPLGTDLVIAEAMAREGAARIGESGLKPVLLPSVSFTAAPFAASFPGTLAVSAETVTSLLLDLARELTRQGFAALAVANAHLDPAHRRSLATAAERAREAGHLPVVVPDLARRPWAARLTEEFRTGACHAGRFEGSIVMAERPALVRRAIQDALPANPASLSDAIRNGASTFEEAGGPRAYFGWPADATAEEGRATVEELGRILRDAVLETLRPERVA
ncbi:MAG TPA: creatininase family protein [Candidatus Eisenbacteria bacterium]|nr:creatininase family protein [Candidatus Eisenbacteria bacterium]